LFEVYIKLLQTLCICPGCVKYRGADKSLARPPRKLLIKFTS